MDALNAPVRLEWDTEFFGFPIASLEARELGAEGARALADWARAQGVACVYARSEATDTASHRALESLGGRLVDVRITLDLDGSRLVSPPPELLDAVRPARPEDVPALRAIAAGAHLDSRFFQDERFDRGRAAELFATWIEKSVNGWADRVIVPELDGSAVGYVTGHLRGDGKAEIGLVGVAEHARGRRLGTCALIGLMRWLDVQGVRRVYVATQGRNVGAQRLYQGLGFRTARVQLVHHLWFREPSAR